MLYVHRIFSRSFSASEREEWREKRIDKIATKTEHTLPQMHSIEYAVSVCDRETYTLKIYYMQQWHLLRICRSFHVLRGELQSRTICKSILILIWTRTKFIIIFRCCFFFHLLFLPRSFSVAWLSVSIAPVLLALFQLSSAFAVH